MTSKYIIYERDDLGIHIIARINSEGEIIGEKASDVREMLEEADYPKIAPDKILHGSRLWAAEEK